MELANHFLYNGTFKSLTLEGLTGRQAYRTSLFGVGWDDAAISKRTATFESGLEAMALVQESSPAKVAQASLLECPYFSSLQAGMLGPRLDPPLPKLYRRASLFAIPAPSKNPAKEKVRPAPSKNPAKEVVRPAPFPGTEGRLSQATARSLANGCTG